MHPYICGLTSRTVSTYPPRFSNKTILALSHTRTFSFRYKLAKAAVNLTRGNRMSLHKPYQPTPQQILIAQAKKAERLRKKQEKAEKHDAQVAPSTIIRRPWLTTPTTEDIPQGGRHAKVLTWNLLAQCLVRRELFPASDCLKAGQREKMLQEELLSQNADILCLQEVDRLEKILPVLDQAGYSYRYAAGRGKKHGCLIAFKKGIFEPSHERVIFYDEQAIRKAGNERARCGHSFNTRNIGLVLSLRFRDDKSTGMIVATTHLFWHPKYTYERARQAGILVREVLDFQKTQQAEGWPCFVAGDFNCPPNDAVYSLLTGQPLSGEHANQLSCSRVTHVSVDPSVPHTESRDVTEEDGGEPEESDPDRVITNARSATAEDGLLSDDELLVLFAQRCRLRSAYDEGLSTIQDRHVATFGGRASLQPIQRGYYEPAYTSYTHYWKSVLDYIFFIPPQNGTCTVIGLLAPHRTEDFGSGLPLKGVSASDHVSLVVQLSWSRPCKCD